GSLGKIVEATNQLKADVVLFTGDFIDLSLADLDRGINAMKQIDPRHGLALIEGNHDLIEDPEAFDRRTRAAGLPLLVDEAMTIRYWSGLYKKGASQLVVTNGVGNWFPLRANAPAAIIDLTLHAA